MSKFRFYSLGIVVINKLFNSDIITVCPVEKLPDLKGVISKIADTKTNSSMNASGSHNTNVVNMKASLQATWIALGSGNRVSSPMVMASETVMLYTFADTQEFYWTTIFRETGLRRLEDVTYMYGNLSSGVAHYDATTSYWMRVNTIDKYIQLHTSNNDGEKVGYDIKLDTGNGVFSMVDTVGNKISLDSILGALAASINQTADLSVPTLTAECSSGVTVTTPTLKLIGNLEVSGTIHATQNISTDMNVVATGNVSGGAGAATIGSSGAIISGPINTSNTITAGGNITAPEFIGNLHGAIV